MWLKLLLCLSLLGSMSLIWYGTDNSISKRLCLWLSLVNYMLIIWLWRICRRQGGYSEVILGVNYSVDNVTISLLWLTGLLIPLCIVNIWDRRDVVKYGGLLILTSGIVIGCFTVNNVLWFYLYFEGVLIPVYIIISKYGSGYRKIRASYYLFIYTVFGSVFMLLGVLLLYIESGSLDYNYIWYNVELDKVGLIWLLFMLGFIVKIPVLPVHLWLAEAHVEAPTECSVLLAGVLLKLGTYGWWRYNSCLLGMASSYYTWLISMMCIVGLVYTSMTAIRQNDIKRVIAYGSIGHMSMIVLGLLSNTEEGTAGGILQMIGHGVVSGGLFFCVGVLYKRVSSKLVWYSTGLCTIMPVWSSLFLVLLLGNMSLPGTSNFVGELMIVTGVFMTNKWIGLICCVSMVLCGSYSLWMYNKLMFNNIKSDILMLWDVNKSELNVLLTLCFTMLVIGVYPSIIIGNL